MGGGQSRPSPQTCSNCKLGTCRQFSLMNYTGSNGNMLFLIDNRKLENSSRYIGLILQSTIPLSFEGNTISPPIPVISEMNTGQSPTIELYPYHVNQQNTMIVSNTPLHTFNQNDIRNIKEAYVFNNESIPIEISRAFGKEVVVSRGKEPEVESGKMTEEEYKPEVSTKIEPENKPEEEYKPEVSTKIEPENEPEEENEPENEPKAPPRPPQRPTATLPAAAPPTSSKKSNNGNAEKRKQFNTQQAAHIKEFNEIVDKYNALYTTYPQGMKKAEASNKPGNNKYKSNPNSVQRAYIRFNKLKDRINTEFTKYDSYDKVGNIKEQFEYLDMLINRLDYLYNTLQLAVSIQSGGGKKRSKKSSKKYVKVNGQRRLVRSTKAGKKYIILNKRKRYL